DKYKVGTNPPYFDKKFVRDWLEQSVWKKKAPSPKVPAYVIQKTVEKYQEALTLMTQD
ncbi:phosphoribosylaminoimidazolesuccinocarboxamide synthase, partial [Neisseria sp. P0003.S003]